MGCLLTGISFYLKVIIRLNTNRYPVYISFELMSKTYDVDQTYEIAVKAAPALALSGILVISPTFCKTLMFFSDFRIVSLNRTVILFVPRCT